MTAPNEQKSAILPKLIAHLTSLASERDACVIAEDAEKLMTASKAYLEGIRLLDAGESEQEDEDQMQEHLSDGQDTAGRYGLAYGCGDIGEGRSAMVLMTSEEAKRYSGAGPVTEGLLIATS